MSVADGLAAGLAAALGRAPFKLSELISVRTLTGADTLTAQARNVQKLDPGGASRDVTVPADADGLFYIFLNAADAAENLVIKDAAAATIVTIGQDEGAAVYCEGGTWYLLCVVNIELS